MLSTVRKDLAHLGILLIDHPHLSRDLENLEWSREPRRSGGETVAAGIQFVANARRRFAVIIEEKRIDVVLQSLGRPGRNGPLLGRCPRESGIDFLLPGRVQGTQVRKSIDPSPFGPKTRQVRLAVGRAWYRFTLQRWRCRLRSRGLSRSHSRESEHSNCKDSDANAISHFEVPPDDAFLPTT